MFLDDMCVNQREIVNRYTGTRLYVKCGKCPSCLQEKASYRVSRIKAQDSPEFDTLLVGLTYRRNDCPFVFRDDALRFSRGDISSLPVFRRSSYRKVRQNSSYDIDYRKENGIFKLCEVDFVDKVSFSNNKDLAHCFGEIGVCYYPDVQHFLARLRLNLIRNFNYHDEFKTFCCSEYGSKSLRPHFHLIFWIRKGSEEIFKRAIIESWPYGDLSKFDRAIEKCFRASSYVASYVNCSSDFPSFLKTYFKPKHSYSKGFGCNFPVFKLSKILEKFDRGSLSYFVQRDKYGIPSIVELPFPKYVIHRYFPRFKGYSRIPPTSLLSCMRRIRGLYFGESGNRSEIDNSSYYRDGVSISRDLYGVYNSVQDLDITRNFAWYNPSDFQFINKLSFPVYFDYDDIRTVAVRLNNAFQLFNSECGDGRKLDFDGYCKLHQSIWRLFASTSMRLHLQNDDIPLNEKYDNLEDVRCDCEYNGKPCPVGFTHESFKVTDPNKFSHVVVNTQRFTQSFLEHIKHRRVSNTVLSSLYEEL